MAFSKTKRDWTPLKTSVFTGDLKARFDKAQQTMLAAKDAKRDLDTALTTVARAAGRITSGQAIMSAKPRYGSDPADWSYAVVEAAAPAAAARRDANADVWAGGSELIPAG